MARTVNGVSLAYTHDFTYLASLITSCGSHLFDIKQRTSIAQWRFNDLCHMWGNASLGQSVSLNLYLVRISTTLLYGDECWWIDKFIFQTLRGFRSRCLSRILKLDPKSILHKPDLPDVMRILWKKRWLCHNRCGLAIFFGWIKTKWSLRSSMPHSLKVFPTLMVLYGEYVRLITRLPSFMLNPVLVGRNSLTRALTHHLSYFDFYVLALLGL